MLLSSAATDSHIAEAAQRFGIPEPWNLSVIKAESAVHTRAVSNGGAMERMQIVPAIWTELHIRHDLGADDTKYPRGKGAKVFQKR